MMIRARAAITMIAHSVTQIANGTRFRCMFGQIKRGSRSRNLNLCDGHHILGAVSRIVCRYRIWEMTMRLIRFAIGISLVAVSVLGSARAQSPAELSQVSGQEALTNRFRVSGFGDGPAQ